jgi:hypothetical protein
MHMTKASRPFEIQMSNRGIMERAAAPINLSILDGIAQCIMGT